MPRLLTREEYSTFRLPAAPAVAEEVEWYASGEGLVGVLNRDRFDRDWGYVVFVQQGAGWKTADLEVCIEDQSTARSRLLAKLS